MLKEALQVRLEENCDSEQNCRYFFCDEKYRQTAACQFSVSQSQAFSESVVLSAVGVSGKKYRLRMMMLIYRCY